MEHTPLPWWNESAVIHASNGRGGATHPANCTPADFLEGDWARAEADAEFICRAVNNHEALLSALERITSAIEHGQIAAATLLAEDARAAILAAKGD